MASRRARRAASGQGPQGPGARCSRGCCHRIFSSAILVKSMSAPVTLIRRAAVVAVLIITVLAQSASLNAEQETHHASQHCCWLCHVGPAPILPTAVRSIIAPSFSSVWLAIPLLVGAAHEVLITSVGSRAPPA